MSDIPFRVTCKGTGESHIIKTDENGYFSSESGWNAHSKNTNGGGAYDGLWFSTGDGKAAVDDSLGAMPYQAVSFYRLPNPYAVTKGVRRDIMAIDRLLDECAYIKTITVDN